MPARTKRPTCKHPPQHVHPCFDARWETCDLCHITRPAIPPAPWILAHDEALPAEQPPALFAALESAPEVRTVPVPAVIAESRPKYIKCPRCLGKGRTQVQPIWPQNAPPVWIECPRCRKAGAIVAYHVEPEQQTTTTKAQVIA